MIRLQYKTDESPVRIDATLTLDFEARQSPDQDTTLDDGRAASIRFARGIVLADGDVLTDDARSVFVRVLAAAETLSYVHCPDRLLLNRVCYHLGNQRVPLEVTCEAVVYRHDHVLDDLMAGLGVRPKACCCAFHPEPGAGQTSAFEQPSTDVAG